MESWRSEAERLFPELAGSFERIETSYQLWFELRDLFEEAYDTGDTELVERIYKFGRWCCEQPRGTTAKDDLLTSTSVSFIEHIPEHERALQDMPRWFSLEEIKGMQSLFTYSVGPEGYARILKVYDA